MNSATNHKTCSLWLVGALHAFTHIYHVALLPLYLLMQRDFKFASVAQATALVTVQMVAYFLPSYAMGVLADRVSRKKLLGFGLLINALGYVGLAFAPNYACAMSAVIVAGIGGSFYHPAATAMVARLYPVGTGRALGLIGIGASVGFFAGPIYSGWRATMLEPLLGAAAWRRPVLELGVLGVLAAILFACLADDDSPGRMPTTAARSTEKLFPTPLLWLLFLAGALAFSLRDFAGSAMGSLGSLFLQQAHGYDARHAGLALSGIFLASAVSNPLFGHLSDRGRKRWTASVLLIAVVLVLVFPHVPAGWAIPLFLTYGFFFMSSYPMVEAALMQSVPDGVRGRVFGLFITVGGLLGNLSHWIVGEAVRRMGAAAPEPASYFTLYGILAGMILLSLLGLLCLHAIRKREQLDDNPGAAKQMNLPNYFIADLPVGTPLSPTMLAEACATLKRNREQYLVPRTTDQIVKFLANVAEGWLQADNPFRKLALAQAPGRTGFGRPTLERGLDQFFGQLTRENLRALLVQELGDVKRLDSLVATPGEEKFSRAAIATGPEFLVHIAAGNIPNPTLMSLVLGLLTRSAQFVKCGSGAAFLPRLFAHSIYDADHKLGACLEIAEWRGGNGALEAELFAAADCVTATGSDETLAAIRAKLPLRTRLLGHGHRVSFGYVTGEALFGHGAKKIVAAAADDVVAWNQLGCLSPHVIYVQRGGEFAPEHFAQLLAEELERRESVEPRGEVTTEVAAAIASRRGIYEVRAAHSPETQLWHSKHSTAWTVVCEADARFSVSCLYRFIYVKAVADLKSALQNADAVCGKISTVGLAAADEEAQGITTALARWGVTRVCPLGQMQNPPLTWRHDGRPALGDLVTWTDYES